MNKNQRDKFLKIVEAKYSMAQVIDPWEKKPSIPKPMPHIINELEILQAIKNVPGVMLFPHTYRAEIPQEVNYVTRPWGPTITFVYGTAPVPENLRQIGDLNIMNQVEEQLKTKLDLYIHAISTEYQGRNTTGQSTYEVTITQKA